MAGEGKRKKTKASQKAWCNERTEECLATTQTCPVKILKYLSLAGEISNLTLWAQEKNKRLSEANETIRRVIKIEKERSLGKA